VALPGERLSKAGGGLTDADLAAAEVFTLDDLESTAATEGPAGEDGGSPDGGRRRRRRGGRGRGRGRGRDEVAAELAAPGESPEFDEDDEPQPSRSPRPTTPFGSVWDSQLGTSVTPSSAGLGPIADDEEFEEPEIPEYLIAEQRRGSSRGGRGGGRGPRGGRSAYQSAIERERYGRGGGGGGINRYPDVSGRGGRGGAPREERQPDRRRDDRAARPAPRSSSEPWSEVPPELEAMLRAQVAHKPAETPEVPTVATDASSEGAAAPKRRTTRTKSTAPAIATEGATEAPKRRTTRKSASSTEAVAAADAGVEPETTATKPKRATTRTSAAKSATTGTDAAAKPKRATTRKTTTAKAAAADTEPATEPA
jgi:hypothetical protein